MKPKNDQSEAPFSLTTRARRALKIARRRARLRGLSEVSAEDLLSSVLELRTGVACSVLIALGVDVSKLSDDLEALCATTWNKQAGSVPPLSTFAPADVCRELGGGLDVGAIGTEHLLLNVIKMASVSLTAMLETHGLRYDVVRAKIQQLGRNDQRFTCETCGAPASVFASEAIADFRGVRASKTRAFCERCASAAGTSRKSDG